MTGWDGRTTVKRTGWTTVRGDGMGDDGDGGPTRVMEGDGTDDDGGTDDGGTDDSSSSS